MPIAVPADKRFRRAHVTPTRRRMKLHLSWKRLASAAVLGALVLSGGYYAATLALSAGALTVTRITVSGNARMARGEVMSLLEGLTGSNMIRLDLAAWRQKLLASPWVADAAIRRVLPGTVDVLISEREPIGIARLGQVLYLIDREGNVVDEFGPNYAEFDLAIIDGVAEAGPQGGPVIDQARAAFAARLLTSLQAHPDLSRRVSQVDVTDLRDGVVILDGDTTLVRVGDEQFAERLQSYVDLAPALREQVPDMDYVDVRFGERVYVRPQASGPRSRTTTGID